MSWWWKKKLYGFQPAKIAKSLRKCRQQACMMVMAHIRALV
jgi:hypothetical protein